jgi:hypothetical protein
MGSISEVGSEVDSTPYSHLWGLRANENIEDPISNNLDYATYFLVPISNNY